MHPYHDHISDKHLGEVDGMLGGKDWLSDIAHELDTLDAVQVNKRHEDVCCIDNELSRRQKNHNNCGYDHEQARVTVFSPAGKNV